MAIRPLVAFLSLLALEVRAGPQAAAQAEAQAASPAEIVAAAPAAEWRAIAPRDLLVMDLPSLAQPELVEAESPQTDPVQSAPFEPAPSDAGEARPSETVPAAPRRVVIQLMAPPYSQGWVANIRVLAAARWWDGLAIVRAQDNYVVQWGDPGSANPQSARPLPASLQTMPPQDYVAGKPGGCGQFAEICPPASLAFFTSDAIRDVYADRAGFVAGWPVAVTGARSWPVHCYGTVGVGHKAAPDTGAGTDLYAVIGHAPRQLDRNAAVVGRVIEGMEHLSSLPRSMTERGFYASPEERTPILSIRRGDEVEGLAAYQYLETTSDSFARYVKALANPQDGFTVTPAGAADVCNVPVPVRKVPLAEAADPNRKPVRAGRARR